MWEKLGRIFDPEACREGGWFATHAALPVARLRENNLCRVYFSGRDERNRARIGWFEFDLRPPYRIERVSPRPVLTCGDLGAFDDSGVTVSSIVEHEGRSFLYYSGWSLGKTVPFYFFIGLAVSEDGENFHRFSRGPLLDRNDDDPYLLGSPFVLVREGVWRMWYVSATGWKVVDEKPRHYYLIKYAESKDGLKWRRRGRPCLNFAAETEYAFSRPHVIAEEGRYRMWYACRGEAYHIGYAESDDGLAWVRKDREAGIELSREGWDAEMMTYPFLFDHEGVRYMLYNGNGYGRSGIGLAVWRGD